MNTMRELSPDELGLRRRLGFVRYMLELALMQRHNPEPLCYAALMTLHDAVELFLAAACSYRNVGTRDMKFHEYFKHLDDLTPSGLVHKLSVQRLNGARVQLKHQGVWPHRLELIEFGDIARAFLEENSQLLFGFTLAAASLVSFVQPEPVRTALEAAEGHIERNDPEEAALQISIAFAHLTRYYGIDRHRRVGSPLGMARIDGDAARLVRYVEELERQLMHVQDVIVGMQLGVTDSEFRRFLHTIPITVLAHDGSPQSRSTVHHKDVSRDEVMAAHRLAVRVALQLTMRQRSGESHASETM